MHYVVAMTDSASETSRSVSPSETTLFRRIFGKFELMILPLTIAAALGGSGDGRQYYRTIVRSKASGSFLNFANWNDAWIYTEEVAAVAEIRALNELLALPAQEGPRVDLDDE
jgi:hypothetical protein